MTKHLLSLAAVALIASPTYAQSSNGLIGHWKMSGNAQDASGNANHGIVRSVTPAAGRDGIPGTAMYFSGNASWIQVPYNTNMNVSSLSMCATVKVEKFYDGSCQGNYILSRDIQFTPSSYSLNFFDNAYNNCATFDSTKEVFAAEAGSNSGSHANWQTASTIRTGNWYRVVGTWDGSAFRIYVNDTLRSTNAIGSPAPLGSSTAGLLFGRMDTAGGYQYPFTGTIDDIRVYNRVLNPEEIVQYGKSTVGVNELRASMDLSLYPNPAANTVSIQGDVIGASYRVYNNLGQLSASGEFSGNARDIGVGSLAPGMYHVRISRGDASATMRFTKL